MTHHPLVNRGIVVRGLSKRFASVQALDSVDLEVAPGEIVTLLGENGAGKSTLLRILGTTVLADSGTAQVGGYCVEGQADGARSVTGLVSGDERAWYWRLSGRQNLEFFARARGIGRRSARSLTEALLHEVELEDAADRLVGQYSAGMRARLALARSSIGSPSVLLLDEPSRALDPVAARAFRERAGQLARDGRAILYATHDLHEAAALDARVVVLHRGKVAASTGPGSDAAALEDLILRSMR